MEKFTDRLAAQLEVFRRLEELQKSALASVQSGDFAALEGFKSDQAETLEALGKRTQALAPSLRAWEGLDTETRRNLRVGKLADLLAEMEAIAQSIQKRHSDQFEGKPQPESLPASRQDGDLSDRIRQYRQLS